MNKLLSLFIVSFLWAFVTKLALELQFYYSTGPVVG